MHDLSISCAYFHFVQQVARYEATYSSHERVFIRATSCTLRGDLSLSWACFHSCNKLHATRRPIPHASVFISCNKLHATRQPIPLMSVFSFVQQVARYEATYPSHERIFISCNKLHAMRRPIHPMSVFSFIPVACILMHDLSIPWAYFHFVQQVARY